MVKQFCRIGPCASFRDKCFTNDPLDVNYVCPKKPEQGCGGGLVVSVLAFYSNNPSSIPAEVYIFFCKIVVEKNENKQKEAGVGPIFFKKRRNTLNLSTRRWAWNFVL